MPTFSKINLNEAGHGLDEGSPGSIGSNQGTPDTIRVGEGRYWGRPSFRLHAGHEL